MTNDMKVILLHNDYNEQHLIEVRQEMQTLGAPKIHAVWMECYCAWQALEGCHRLRAAKELGLTPTIIPVEWSETRKVAEIVDVDMDNDLTIEELCDRCYNCVQISFLTFLTKRHNVII